MPKLKTFERALWTNVAKGLLNNQRSKFEVRKKSNSSGLSIFSNISYQNILFGNVSNIDLCRGIEFHMVIWGMLQFNLLYYLFFWGEFIYFLCSHCEFWLRNGIGKICLWKKYILIYEWRQNQEKKNFWNCTLAFWVVT